MTTKQPGSHQMTALDRLKILQAQFKKTWNGINVDFTGRPGTSNMTNPHRKFRPLPKLDIEDERNTLFLQIFDTLRNIEGMHPLLLPSGNDPSSRTASNFYKKQTGKFDPNQIVGFHYKVPVQVVNQV